LLGTGTGSFATATSFAAGSGPNSVAVGDFNGDGKQDLVVANYFGNNVSILLGTGTGGFGTGKNFVGGADAKSVAARGVEGGWGILTGMVSRMWRWRIKAVTMLRSFWVQGRGVLERPRTMLWGVPRS